MSINLMNVGVDYALSYWEPLSGALVDLGEVQNVTINAQKHDIVSRPYNKVPLFGYIPDGFRITFNITRSTSVLEDLMVTLSANFNAGGITPAGYLNETINNADGTVSRYQYTGFVIFLTDHGDISREKVVTLKLEGMASDKIQLA